MRTLLTWRKPTDHPQDRDYAVWMADGIGGRYSIESGGLLWFAHDEFIWEQCEDEAAAKARAEADFRERLAPFVARIAAEREDER